MVACGRKKNRKTDEEHDENALKRDFSWPGQNLTEMAREPWKLLGWGILVSIFEMNQN